jgi:hypothetical protein
MKHFHRTSVLPGAVLMQAELFFPTIGMTQTAA